MPATYVPDCAYRIAVRSRSERLRNVFWVRRIIVADRVLLPAETPNPLCCSPFHPATKPQLLRYEVQALATDFRIDFSNAKRRRLTSFTVPRRGAIALIFSSFLLRNSLDTSLAQSIGFREYIDNFNGYSFMYPHNWIQVRGAGADIFFRDPYVLDVNLSLEISSPSSSKYQSVEDLGPPQEAAKKALRQYLTEFMSTRLGVRRESSILSSSSRVADDGRLYYQVEVNIKSYANNNELAVMPQDRVARLEWDRRYLSVLGVENNRLYELRIQTPEKEFS
ncbi:unnamed protein product, partial [Cuscuta europaea]